ncbi:hypothetical protein Hypma_016276 [Hypsizygus marmoreus]|uniref:Uncharacterized protein n=1 Tax=Hypsizygus marmoreus TaxID=39966 RepID=A0A369J0F0_HYPMA|nr:hypothetical protein Hypma_016276 [Hypsizygus marmoreus]
MSDKAASTASLISTTTTLCSNSSTKSSDAGGNATKSDGKAKKTQGDKSVAGIDSAFAAQAAKKGWAAPTATHPTFNF